MTPRPSGPSWRQGDPPARPDPVRSPDAEGVPAEEPVWTAGGGLPVTPAITAYLRTVFLLREGGNPVPTMQIAQELGISGPSVTNMVKRLDELKMLRHARYHGVVLTTAGERVALEVLRHHRLLEMYLAESLGFPWDEVHEEAERLEHLLSDNLERRIDHALGHPTFDPHGAPIPTADGHMPALSDRRLSDMAVGDVATVEQVSDRDPEQLRYLGSLGLVPGQRLELRERLPFEGPIRLLIGEHEHLIGAPLARIVHVVVTGTGTDDPTDPGGR